MDNNENTRPVCSCCGATLETDDYYTFEGSILCDECYHSETVTCEHCGDRIWADDNAGTDSMPLCNSCYDDYYTTCEANSCHNNKSFHIILTKARSPVKEREQRDRLHFLVCHACAPSGACIYYSTWLTICLLTEYTKLTIYFGSKCILSTIYHLWYNV